MTRPIFAFSAIVALGACSESMTSNASVTVSSVSPAPYAVDVAHSDTIEILMEMPMDSASCALWFTLHRNDSTGAEIPGRFRFGDGYRRMMFIPDSLLEPATRYFAHMRDSMTMNTGMHGNGMGGQMVGGGRMMTGSLPSGAVRMRDGMGWSFTTGN